MSCDTSTLTFDISSSAGLYSTMAGVLAAFAFGAITLVLPGEYRRHPRPDTSEATADEQSDVHVLLALVAAFMSLIIATLEYAVINGERGCALIQGRAASEEFLGGVAFAFAVLLLLYAVVHMVTHSGIAGIGQHVRFIVAVLGPPLAVLFLITGAEDAASSPWVSPGAGQPYGPQLTAFYHETTLLALPLPAGLLVACTAMWWLGRKIRHDKSPAGGGRVPALLVIFPYMSLFLAIAAVARSTTLAETNPSDRIHQWEVWTGLAVSTVVLTAQAALLLFERGADTATRTTPSTQPDGPTKQPSEKLRSPDRNCSVGGPGPAD